MCGTIVLLMKFVLHVDDATHPATAANDIVRKHTTISAQIFLFVWLAYNYPVKLDV